MTIYVGTSGYNYTEWRGIFYSEKFPTTKMFDFYAERFFSVEINYTYYHIPAEKVVDNWAAPRWRGLRMTSLRLAALEGPECKS